MSRKTIVILLALMVLAALPVLGGCSDSEEATHEYLVVTGSVTGSEQSEICTNIRWKNVEGAKKYIIYRSNPVKSETSAAGGKLKMTRMDTLSRRTNEYKDQDIKYKKWYCYKVVVRKKTDGKESSDSQELIVYTGLAQCRWEEDLDIMGYTSPDRIDLRFDVPVSLRPQGFVISRKTSGGRFRNVADLKGGYSKKWKDTEVGPGKSYTYRVRAYRKMGKKRLYGTYSKELKRSAVNLEGKYRLKAALDNNGPRDQFVVKIESEEGNGEIRITDKNWYAFGLSSQNDPNALKFECAKPSSKTKNDQLELPKGMRFRSMKKNGLVLKGGEAGYIRITGQDVSGDNDKRMISFPEIKYNGMISVLDLDVDKMKGKAFVMSEYYQK